MVIFKCKLSIEGVWENPGNFFKLINLSFVLETGYEMIVERHLYFF